MTTDINQQIRQHFDNIYKSAMEDAQLQTSTYYERLKLHTLDLDDQLLSLIKELGLLDKEIEDFEHKEYLHFASHEENCFKIYSSRLLFYKLNEEAQLRRGCILSDRRSYLIQLFGQTELKLPPFTFFDFLSNKRNVVFYESGRKPLKTNSEDNLKIRSWQIQKKMECVSMEAKKFKERFIGKVGENYILKELIEAEAQQLEYIYENASQLTTQQFITELLKLKALPVDSIPEDANEFHHSFCKFIAKESMRSSLSPQFFETALQHIQSGKISNPPICCWSFVKYDQWLADVLKEKIDLRDVSEPSYGDVFDHTFYEGFVMSQRVIFDFKRKYPSEGMTEEEYKTVILGELNKLRTPFNQLKDLNYYYLINDKEAIKNHFLNNCLLKNGIAIQIEELKKTVVLYNTIAFLHVEFLRIDKNPVEAAIDQMELDSQITEVIASMVPKTELINQLLKVLQSTLQQSLQGKIPVLFIARNLKDTLHGIYKQAEAHLEQIFKKEPTNKKAPFVSYQLKDVQLKERAVIMEGLNLHELFKQLKEVLSIEQEYLKLQVNYNPIDINDLLQEPEANYMGPLTDENGNGNKNKTGILAFNYNSAKVDNLNLVLSDLHDLNAISSDIKVSHFRKLFNGTEVAIPIVWLAGQGDLMVFIKEAMKNTRVTFPHQQQWNIAIKCFVKEDGSRFDSTKLKTSKPTIRQFEFEKAAQRF